MDQRKTRQQNIYQYGSAVPAVPGAEPERRRKKKSSGRDELLKEVRVRVNQRSKRDRAYSPKQILVLGTITVLCLILCSLYIYEAASLYSTKTNIARLQLTYQEAVQENLMKENSISRQIDYNEVYRYATEELQMQVPEKHQVIYYEPAAEEYVVNGGANANE